MTRVDQQALSASVEIVALARRCLRARPGQADLASTGRQQLQDHLAHLHRHLNGMTTREQRRQQRRAARRAKLQPNTVQP